MNTLKRLKIDERKKSILKAGIILANKKGYDYKSVTREQIAKYATCSPALITHYFGNMKGLQKELIKFALKYDNYKVIVQALTNGELDKGTFCMVASVAIREKIRKQFAS